MPMVTLHDFAKLRAGLKLGDDMINKMSSQLNIDIQINGDDNKNLVRNNRSDDAASERNFNDLIANLNATLADSLTAISINNANESSKTDYVPILSGNVGNFAASVSSDGTVSSPVIKQAPTVEIDDDFVIDNNGTSNNTIKLGKIKSMDL